MNPVDHPHGGGEGRTSGGRDPVTPWGVSTKGKKTRNNKKTDVFIIKKKEKIMTRSVWKGPFVDITLIEKGRKTISVWKKRSFKNMVQKINNSSTICRINFWCL